MNAEMEPPPHLNPELVTKTLNFHGQLLQKAWEGERGDTDLIKHNVTNLDFGIYSQRQKHLSFQDRGKRLKLHQFISKRADLLFDNTLIERVEPASHVTEPGQFALLPPFESFLNLDKTSRSQHFLQCLKPEDVIICSITSKANSGLVLKVLCADGEVVRCVGDLGVKAFCPTSNLISAVDKKNIPRTFMLNDIVACEVLEVMPDSEKIICGMKGVHASKHNARLGLFHSDDYPEVYKLSLEAKTDTYEECLTKSVGFHNPSNVTCLATAMGLGNAHHTNMMAFKSRFPETEYASELRTVQAAKWAFRNVADGIEHFKASRATEAFQCLNKALAIDPANIEGLVARGALYANGGSFKKAIDDFECALKQNHSHANARKYMGETLVAYGRSFEDQNKMDEAVKCYEKCLEVVPYHEEAQNSIEFIKTKMANGSVSLTDGLVSIGSLGGKAGGVKNTLKMMLGNEQPSKDEAGTSSAKKKKKEKKAKKHKRGHSSSSSSSSSSGSSSSSSSSSSSDTSSVTSNDSHRKKKHKRKSEPKEKSLSPLSKRMAIMDSGTTAETDGQRGSHYNPPAMPFSFSSDPVPPAAGYQAAGKTDKESEYEQRVCKFLEQTKGDSDYEEKVRKFLDETAKWKKDRKAYEEKAKKKRKKEKKARSKNKKKKREERKKKKMIKEIEEKKLRDALRKQRRRSNNVEEDDEFLYGEKPDLRLSLPDLEDLQSKLSYYVKVEKGNSSSKKKEKSNSVEKLVAAVQAKKAAASPKVLYLEEEKEEAMRMRKLEKKKMDMFEPSPSPPRVQDAKNVPLPSAPPPASKFKMQLGAGQNRMKKRGDKSEEKETWDDVGEKRFIYVSDNVGPPKEPELKKLPDKKKEVEEQMAKTPMIMDKLGGFRINPLNAEKKIDNDRPTPMPQKRKLRSRVSESDSSDSDVAAKKKERQMRSPPSSRSRSRSRSHKKYSSESPPPKKYSSSSSRSPSYRKDRSRSKSGSYRSRSGRRYRSSESGSYRTRSRSRSRSMDYHRRSRSRSDDRHHYRKYPGRYPRNRGTYYRPRFQTGFKSRPGFFPRGRGGPWRPGGRPFIPRMRGRGRPRFFHYKPRDDRYRRYERDMSRSDDDDGSPMRKVDAAKERIDRMLSEDKRHTGPLSEGEERDDYMERERGSPDMDRGKKEGSKERGNKPSGKPNPW